MNASYLLLGDVAMGTPTGQSMSRSMSAAPIGAHRFCCREIARLHSENARLADELDRVRGLHADLTKSAEIWIRLYETYLDLASARAGSGPVAPQVVGQ